MKRNFVARKEIMKGDPVIVGDNVHSFEVYPASWLESCDHCRAQSPDRHYCLLHSAQLRDMDTIRCNDWQATE